MNQTEPIIKSILDTDLYKLSMSYAVIKKYPRMKVVYRFFNRNKTPFPDGFAKALKEQINMMSELQLTKEEADFLNARCGYFLDNPYIDFLKGYRYDPSEVDIEQTGGELKIDIKGFWYRTIYWEVPLMALISELYFSMSENSSQPFAEQKSGEILSLESSRLLAVEKAQKLCLHNVKFAEFGTRRRYSLANHEAVLKGLCTAGDNLAGTSNVMFAHKYGLRPIGTQAHEWIMVHGAKYGYRSANQISLQSWAEIFNGNLGIALTDTYTTKAFFDVFETYLAKLFDGVRHDSGDPIAFARNVINHYEKLRIDPKDKTIVFSDGLDVDKAIEINSVCNGKIKASFGIGTNFTNDVGYKPLNMVIKVVAAEVGDRYISTVKLSDDVGKHTGDSIEVDAAYQSLGM